MSGSLAIRDVRGNSLTDPREGVKCSPQPRPAVSLGRRPAPIPVSKPSSLTASNRRKIVGDEAAELCMGYIFPSQAWVESLIETLNSDAQYAEIARNWEGDLVFVIEPDQGSDPQQRPDRIYLDLWHGKCRGGYLVGSADDPQPAARYVLRAPRANFLRILSGDLDAMQAMLTRKLQVRGSMAYMLRNVPTVLDFVRCARRVEIAG